MKADSLGILFFAMFFEVPFPGRLRRLALLLAVFAAACLPVSARADVPPPGLKVAFLGDQGIVAGSVAVLDLIKKEKADALIHLGDFDYTNDPEAWEGQTDSVLGKDFPMAAVVGNHDLWAWSGPVGYQERIRARLARQGIDYEGEAGVQYSFTFKGVFFVLTAPGLMRSGHAAYIKRELARDTSAWKVSCWHMNQAAMQVGSKPDEVGWDVYEESRAGGAIIATAHEHSYSRTHLLSRFRGPVVSSKDNLLRLRKGRTFAFVSGMGGSEVRPQYRSGDWWAAIYTANQGAKPGALFAVFHVDGNPRLAEFYFKAIDGTVADRFRVVSEAEVYENPGIRFPPAKPRTLVIDPKSLGIPPGGSIRLDDLNGRSAARVDDLRGTVSVDLKKPGLLFLRGGANGLSFLKTVVVLP